MSEEKEQIGGTFAAVLKRNSSQIKAGRAEQIIEDAELNYRRRVEDTILEIRNLQRRREAQLDLNPSTTHTIVNPNDFDASSFVFDDMKSTVELENLNLKLSLYRARYKELFGKDIGNL